MKKFTILFITFFSFLSVLMFCDDKGSEPDSGDDPVVPDSSIFGMWRDTIPSVSVFTNLKIVEIDSTFLITVLQAPDSLLRQAGMWEIIEDSIYLHGKEGAIIDTNTNTLVPLPDSLAEQTIVLDTIRNAENVWEISGQSLAPVIDNFPVDDWIKTFIKAVQFTFIKDSTTLSLDLYK